MSEKLRITPDPAGEMISSRFESASPAELRRRRLYGIFERLREGAAEILPPEAQRELEAIYGKFQERRFFLVLLGQFKRGKTTLLNGLVGSDLLPTGVLPLTSIVSLVRYGSEPGARVRFTNGTSRAIAPSELAAYVTERGNPKNRKGVLEVEVFYPSERLKKELCLIDTPGIASIFERNTQVAYQFVPKADAAIFVFSPEPPLSRAELEFLHHIRGHVNKVFFVLNKSDQVRDRECKEILEFARQAIREQLPAGELRFFTLSARQALDALERKDPNALRASGLPALWETLEEFLTAHGSDVIARSTCAALRRVVHNELLSLELEARALTLTVEGLARKIVVVERTWEELEVRRREVGHILCAEVRALEADLEKELNTFVQGEEVRLLSYMKAQVETHRRASKRKLTEILDETLRAKIAEIFEEWKIREEKAIEAAFAALTSRFSGEATRIVEEIQRAATEQFGFSWSAAPLPDRLTACSEFYTKVDDLMLWGLG